MVCIVPAAAGLSVRAEQNFESEVLGRLKSAKNLLKRFKERYWLVD